MHIHHLITTSLSMSKYAYIFEKASPEHMQWMQAFGCDELFTESAAHERFRPQLHRLLTEIGPGDTLVVVKLATVIRHSLDLHILIDFCLSKGIRLISIDDGIDSENKCFEDGYKSLLRLLAELSKESSKFKRTYQTKSKVTLKGCPMGVWRNTNLERDKQIVNMYKLGYSYADISSLTNIRGRLCIVRILKEHGVVLRRSKDCLSSDDSATG